MKKLAELINSEMKWTQPGAFTMNYELQAGRELAATLQFRSMVGSLATGKCADGCWTFKRMGLFQTRVTIRVCGSETDIAIFKNTTWSGGGTVEMPGGRKVLVTTNLWQSNLEFKTESGESLIHFTPGGVIHLSAQVRISQAAAGLAELAWLVMLGCYLIVMLQMDAEATAAIIG
jgi:hypothetical protein